MNADDAAAALAVGLGAERILFLTDVPGVLVDDSVLAVDRRRRGRGRGEGSRAGSCRSSQAAVVAGARRASGRDRRDDGGRMMLATGRP